MSAAELSPEELAASAQPRERSLTRTLVLLIAVPVLLVLMAWLGLWLIDAHERRGICRNFSVGPIVASWDGDIRVDYCHWFTWHYAILEIGDVRVAVRATRLLPAPTGASGSGNMYVKSGASRAALDCGSGTGKSSNPFMTWYVSESTRNGATTIQVGPSCPPETTFTIRDAAMFFADREVKIGEGPRVVFLRKDGTVESVEAVQP